MALQDSENRSDMQVIQDEAEETNLMSRRGMLRRSVLGISGIGLASLLAACGGDDDDDADDPAGVDDVDDMPADEDPVGGDGANGLDEDAEEVDDPEA